MNKWIEAWKLCGVLHTFGLMWAFSLNLWSRKNRISMICMQALLQCMSLFLYVLILLLLQNVLKKNINWWDVCFAISVVKRVQGTWEISKGNWCLSVYSSVCLVIKNDSCSVFCQVCSCKSLLWNNTIGRVKIWKLSAALLPQMILSSLSPPVFHCSSIPTPIRHLSLRLDNTVTVYYRLSHAIIFNHRCHSHIKISCDKTAALFWK